MANGWNGPDPIADDFADDQEVGTVWRAEVDITITGVRVWTDASEINLTNRRGRIWSTAGGQLGIATLPNDLPPGWSTYDLDVPVIRLAGQLFVSSFSTGGNEGFVNHGLDNDVPSADGAVTALSGTNSPIGNGLFSLTPGVFPASASGNRLFFGADLVYTVGVGGNTAPRIQQFTVEADADVATAVVVAVDDETLVGATYRYDWGDGTALTVSSSATAQHTYAASGTYGVLGSVTDADGLADHAAAAVTVVVTSAELKRINSVDLFDQITSHAARLGLFEQVTGHEPKASPGNGLHASVWADSLLPIRASGLALTSGRLAFNVRIQMNMLTEPQDDIDPALIMAADALLSAYSGDFEFSGNVRNVDLLGAHGDPLGWRAGYVQQNGKLSRCVVVTLPLILNDIWAQEA